MANAQWSDCFDDSGNPPFTDQATDLAVPTGDNTGVIIAAKQRTTIRVWNSTTPLAGGFDVEIWQQFRKGEGWFRNEDVMVVVVAAAVPADRAFIEIESRGTLRLFVRVFNIAPGTTATARVGAGTD